MPENSCIFQPIGILHTLFKDIADMPIQPSSASGVVGRLVLESEYVEGLKDLDGFSHIYLIYQFHKVTSYQLTVTPFLDSSSHGVFSTRAPKRPNPIGLSVVSLIAIEDNILRLENVDILDGTPILDIKPYVPAFDQQFNVRVGWLEGNENDITTKRSDERFKS